MKLITERIEGSELKFICEENEGKPKAYFIQGPFLQAEKKNRNGRIYKNETILREVERYGLEKIEKNQALGELDHPPTPTVNLDRVSHIVTDLRMEGDNAIGKAKLIDTPTGKIAMALLDAGIQLGVSSRGVGSLEGDVVNDDYRLLAIDIVAEPSAPEAYVEGILEGKEWIMEGNQIVEQAVKNLERTMSNTGSKYIAEAFQQFLSEVRGSI
jgi:hypothetical protein